MSSKLENDEIAAEAKYPSELFELSSIPRKESISSGGPVVHLVESNENPEPMEEAIELSPSKEELAATDNEALDGDVDGNANETGKGNVGNEDIVSEDDDNQVVTVANATKTASLSVEHLNNDSVETISDVFVIEDGDETMATRKASFPSMEPDGNHESHGYDGRRSLADLDLERSHRSRSKSTSSIGAALSRRSTFAGELSMENIEDANEEMRREAYLRRRSKRQQSLRTTRTRRLSARRKEKKLNALFSISKQTRERTRFMKIIKAKKSVWLRRWVILLVLFSIYLTASIPFRLAFANPPFGSQSWIALLVLDVITELIFLFDIFLTFHVSYFDERGVEVMNPPLIKKNYIEGWLVLDVIAVLPIDLLLRYNGRMPLRVIKMLRGFHVQKKMGLLELDGRLSATFSRTIKLGYSFFLVFHIVGCIWFSFATYGGFGSTIFAPSESLKHASQFTQYMQSLFWSLSLLSNTSIPEGRPTSNYESLFTVLSMTAGMGTISYVVGSVGAWMEQRNHSLQKHERRLRNVLKFLTFNRVDMFLKKQVASYLSYKWAADRGFDRELMFRRLPLALRSMVSTALARNIMEKVPLFTILSDDAMEAVLLRLKPTLLVPGQYVFHKGERAQAMYFIHIGEVEAISHTNQFDFELDDVLNEAHTLAVENVSAMDEFGMTDALMNKTYTYSVRSTSFADVFMLTTYDLLKAMELFPNELDSLMEVVEWNRGSLQEAFPNNSSGNGSEHNTAGANGTNRSSPDFQPSLEEPPIHQVVKKVALKRRREKGNKRHATEPRSPNSIFVMSSTSYKTVRRNRSRLRSTLSQKRNTSMSLKAPLKGLVERESTRRRLSLAKHLSELVIYPNSKFGTIWRYLITLLNFYNIMIVPFRIVFAPDLVSPPLLVIDYVGDVLFLADIYVNFHLAFSRAGFIVSTLSDIQDNYLSTTFPLHVVASLPLDLLMIAFGMTPALRVPRLLRLRDIHGFLFQDTTSMEEKPWVTLIKKVGTLLLVFFVGAHFVACLYFTFTYMEGFATDENMWLPPQYLADEGTLITRYLHSMYFSYNILLRLGVGIVPRTSLEVIFTIVVLLCGVLLVAQLIASFSAFLQVYDHGESHFKQQLSLLTNYLSVNAVSANIQTRVIDFYRFEWSDCQGIDFNSILSCLPYQLRRDVMVNICVPALQRVNVFAKQPRSFCEELACGMSFECISRGEDVYTDEVAADSMYFVRRGRVDLYLHFSEHEKILHDVVTPGRYFGEELFLFDQWRKSAARAEENTHLLRLGRAHFRSVLDQNPKVEESLRELARLEIEKQVSKYG